VRNLIVFGIEVDVKIRILWLLGWRVIRIKNCKNIKIQFILHFLSVKQKLKNYFEKLKINF